MKPALVVAALALSACASVSEPDWQTYADCSAAYEANARLTDPERTVDMRASIGDVAIDYQVAASLRYRTQKGGDSIGAVDAMVSYIAARTPAFVAKSRPELERYIEHCPQPVTERDH